MARAVEGAFPKSKLECTHHDSSRVLCVHEGSIIVEEISRRLVIRSVASRKLEISVAAEDDGHEAIFESVVDAYQAQSDAGGFKHALERE